MKKKDETKAIKVKRYKNRMKSADKAPYLMRVVSNGYNVVTAGESFVMTGDGFLEDGVLSVTLKDAKGVSHDVTVEARKKTALVCSFAAAAKGRATIEVVLAGEEPDTYRFTASRKVTVR